MTWWRQRSHVRSPDIGRWIIFYAVSLHIGWAMLLLASPQPRLTTPLSGFRNFPPMLVTALLFVASFLALIELGRPRRLGIVLLLPQQMILMAAALAAVMASWRGQYPDGYAAPSLFILVDQLPSVLGALFHTGAILEHHYRSPHSR